MGSVTSWRSRVYLEQSPGNAAAPGGKKMNENVKKCDRKGSGKSKVITELEEKFLTQSGVLQDSSFEHNLIVVTVSQ